MTPLLDGIGEGDLACGSEDETPIAFNTVNVDEATDYACLALGN